MDFRRKVVFVGYSVSISAIRSSLVGFGMMPTQLQFHENREDLKEYFDGGGKVAVLVLDMKIGKNNEAGLEVIKFLADRRRGHGSNNNFQIIIYSNQEDNEKWKQYKSDFNIQFLSRKGDDLFEILGRAIGKALQDEKGV